MYKLTNIEDTDIFFFARTEVDLLGEIAKDEQGNLAKGTFAEVLAVAINLKTEAVNIGQGDLVDIVDPQNELTNILVAKWFLLVFADRYQIVLPNGVVPYSLPTNILSQSAHGSLENIFTKIIQLEMN
jgi:hypothetical protein